MTLFSKSYISYGVKVLCVFSQQQIGRGHCTAVVLSLGILSHIERLDTFCQGVQLSLLAFLVSS